MKVLYVAAILLVAQAFADHHEEEKCHCAVFKDGLEHELGDIPAIVSKCDPIHIECDDAGKKACSDKCIELAKGVKDEAPNHLCKKVKDSTVAISPAVYYKICEDTKWHYSGFTSLMKICCKDGVPSDCPQE